MNEKLNEHTTAVRVGVCHAQYSRPEGSFLESPPPGHERYQHYGDPVHVVGRSRWLPGSTATDRRMRPASVY